MKLPDEAVTTVDRPELMETFCDSLGLTTFDGQTARIELCVTRMEAPKPPAKPAAKRYPVVRLAMPPDALIDLFNNLHRLVTGLEQAGVLTKTKKPGDPAH